MIWPQPQVWARLRRMAWPRARAAYVSQPDNNVPTSESGTPHESLDLLVILFFQNE